MAGSFSDFLQGTSPPHEFIDTIGHTTLYFVYIGVAQLVALTVGAYGLNHIGERIATKIRHAYLTAVLRQNIAFFDNTGAGEVAIRISTDVNLVQDGISQKIGLIAYGVTGFFSGIIVALVKEWHLALVMFCVPIAMILMMSMLGGKMKRFQEAAGLEYGKSGIFAEEVISSIRHVRAYGSQDRYIRRYNDMLVPARRQDFNGTFSLGILMAVMMLIVNSGYGLAVRPSHRTSHDRTNTFLIVLAE
jgi:ATP-binding cassette subfamily B (MDR/TAP) protein 1